MCAAFRAGSESCLCLTARKPTPRLRRGFAPTAFSTRKPRTSNTPPPSPADSRSQRWVREDPMLYQKPLSRPNMLSTWAVLILSALTSALPALGQDRMPPVPPDKYDAEEGGARVSNRAQRSGFWALFGPDTKS